MGTESDKAVAEFMSMNLVTAKESREADCRVSEELGIPSLILMENAARAVVEVIWQHFEVEPDQKVVVICGHGNNGGDGLAVARHLKNHGVDVRAYVIAAEDSIGGDVLTNLVAVRGAAVPIMHVTRAKDVGQLEADVRNCSVTVDALLGTGTRGEVHGLAATVIPLINAGQGAVCAVDLPSGINADTGAVCGRVVRADATVTLGTVKRGLVLFPGADFVGDLFWGDISAPIYALAEDRVVLCTDKLVNTCLPKRQADTHKGDYGRVLVVGGSKGMTGAATLAGQAALRGGAGLTRVALPESLNLEFEAGSLEVMSLPLPETGAGTIGPQALNVLGEQLDWADVLAVGPGISRHPETASFLHQLVSTSSKPLVLDADGITAFAGRMDVLEKRNGPMVITPHLGEMAELTGAKVEDLKTDLIASAQAVAGSLNSVIVLKGTRTIIVAPDGETFVNLTGNPGMASAGSGDVLTGLIAALIAQGNEPLAAAACGVFLHGLAGDLASWEIGEAALTAGDLLHHLPRAILHPDLWRPMSPRPLSPHVRFISRGRDK